MVLQCLAMGILRVSSGRIDLLSAIGPQPVLLRVGWGVFLQKKSYFKTYESCPYGIIIGDVGLNLKIF